MKDNILLILVLMLFIMCNKSKNIGGYNENYKVSEAGKITDINVNEFYDYQKYIQKKVIVKI